MKKCSKCDIKKDQKEFNYRPNSKTSLRSQCKSCEKEYRDLTKERRKIIREIYYLNNKEKIMENGKIYQTKYREDNKESISIKNKERCKNYYEKNAEEINKARKEKYKIDKNNPEYKKKVRLNTNKRKDKKSEYDKNRYLERSDKFKNYQREYLSKNKDKVNKRRIIYYEKNKYMYIWRSILKSFIRRSKLIKNNSTKNLLKYTHTQLRHRIESQFREGMSWENYGEWHIDHKKPISKFDKNTPIHIVNMLSNLQPLWASENLKKGNKFIF